MPRGEDHRDRKLGVMLVAAFDDAFFALEDFDTSRSTATWGDLLHQGSRN